jgi:hypothetical protein
MAVCAWEWVEDFQQVPNINAKFQRAKFEDNF